MKLFRADPMLEVPMNESIDSDEGHVVNLIGLLERNEVAELAADLAIKFT